jgi:hypothetical protein
MNQVRGRACVTDDPGASEQPQRYRHDKRQRRDSSNNEGGVHARSMTLRLQRYAGRAIYAPSI